MPRGPALGPELKLGTYDPCPSPAATPHCSPERGSCSSHGATDRSPPCPTLPVGHPSQPGQRCDPPPLPHPSAGPVEPWLSARTLPVSQLGRTGPDGLRCQGAVGTSGTPEPSQAAWSSTQLPASLPPSPLHSAPRPSQQRATRSAPVSGSVSGFRALCPGFVRCFSALTSLRPPAPARSHPAPQRGAQGWSSALEAGPGPCLVLGAPGWSSSPRRAEGGWPWCC